MGATGKKRVDGGGVVTALLLVVGVLYLAGCALLVITGKGMEPYHPITGVGLFSAGLFAHLKDRGATFVSPRLIRGGIAFGAVTAAIGIGWFQAEDMWSWAEPDAPAVEYPYTR